VLVMPSGTINEKEYIANTLCDDILEST